MTFLKTELGSLFADEIMRDPDGFREGLAKALHDLTCHDNHDDPDVGPYTPARGGHSLYQRRADDLIALVDNDVDERYPVL